MIILELDSKLIADQEDDLEFCAIIQDCPTDLCSSFQNINKCGCLYSKYSELMMLALKFFITFQLASLGLLNLKCQVIFIGLCKLSYLKLHAVFFHFE